MTLGLALLLWLIACFALGLVPTVREDEYLVPTVREDE
jgi:hypothetical protein